MSHTIKNAKFVQSKSRSHTVAQVDPNAFTVTSGASGSEYHVTVHGNSGTCYPQDYIFVGENGHLLDVDVMKPDKASEHAQRMARRHRTEVTYAIVCDYKIKPDKCENCGEILPEDGACPCADFGEVGEPVAPNPRPGVPLIVFPTEGQEHIFNVPAGECQYWSGVVSRCVGKSAIMGMDWANEEANVPYLGRVALASDKLAAEWLADVHGVAN